MVERRPATRPGAITPPADRSPARAGTHAICRGYEAYSQEFRDITRRAQERFERRDWHGMRRDALQRLELYGSIVKDVVADVKRVLAGREDDREVWSRMRRLYIRAIAGRSDAELAETFFNSITRKIFDTVGVDPRIEFIASDRWSRSSPDSPPFRVYQRQPTTAGLIRAALLDLDWSVRYRDADGDAERAGQLIDEHRFEAGVHQPIEAIEVLTSPFFRGKGAYLVGRMHSRGHLMPIVIALTASDDGVGVDALLLTENEASVVFGFSRSYFQVDIECPRDVIAFLRSIVPRKSLAELYIALGYNKHGKTELYREMLRHLEQTSDAFEATPGAPGMVMAVFTMPSFDFVFKVIRDSFADPKRTTRRDVMRRYELVFKHDRAGRLADAQEFEHLVFAKERFTRDLLAELVESAGSSVSIEAETVVIKHLYAERRMTPLDIYLREADSARATHAVLDYGQAIVDLASTNIFPGDLLAKNFGVSRHGRVIFYDYDEIGLLTDYQFRELPTPRTVDEEMSAEPWFYVGPNDIFPEEFVSFLGFSGARRKLFLERYAHLFTPRFWLDIQNRHRAGEVPDIFPYPRNRRLRS